MNEPTRIQLPQNFVSAGTRLSGIYEIDAPIAKGGMGEVYRGHTIETGDPVAIKLIRAEMADNEAVLAMFRREASALSRLHHEAIIRYFVFSLDPGLQRHYLAMELVEGEMLSAIVARGPIALEDTTRLLTRIAGGLQAAHERGIVHRDLSPDNIIVEDGFLEKARIIDFGIARSTRLGDTTIIGSGFAGKYNYVSPEQLGLYGGEVTARSDIYSLALVIVQCLRGKALDMAGSQVDVVEKRRRVPDLSGIDQRIRPLLERMLQPDPANRPSGMAEIAAFHIDFKRVLPKPKLAPKVGSPKEVRPTAARQGSPTWKVVTAVAIVGIVAAGGVVAYLQRSEGWAPIQPVSIPTIDRQSQPSGSGLVSQPEPQAEKAAKPVPGDPEDPVDQFIRNYPGGDCFLALPTALGAGSADVDAFGLDRKSFESFDEAFTRSQGFEAVIDGGQVTQAQCAALRVVSDLRRLAHAKAGRLEITRTAVRSGETLTGSLVADVQGAAALFLVDDEGRITDVSQQLAVSASGKRFTLRLTASRPGHAQPVVLVAVTSSQPVNALRGANGLTQNAVAPIAQEVAAQGGGLAVSAKYFKIE